MLHLFIQAPLVETMALNERVGRQRIMSMVMKRVQSYQVLEQDKKIVVQIKLWH